MLHTPIEFPHPGSFAFEKPNAARVRIIEHGRDGTTLISEQVRDVNRGASLTRRVPTATLFATGEEADSALQAKPARKPRRRAR